MHVICKHVSGDQVMYNSFKIFIVVFPSKLFFNIPI